MMSTARWALTALLVIGWFLTAHPAAAQTPAVKDNADYFNLQTVEKANGEIKEIKQQHQKDLIIETFRTVPTSRIAEVEKMNKEAKNKFFDQWSQDRVRVLGLHGIHVLICDAPRHLQVRVTDDTQKMFTTADRDKLRDLFLARLKDSEYNKALEEGVRLVRTRLDANNPVTLARPVVNEVKDYAKFFSSAAVERANVEIEDIKQRFKTNLLFETFPTVPSDKVSQVNGMDSAARNRFFAAWLKDRARMAKVDGIYVLVCDKPKHIQVGSGPNTMEKAFVSENRSQLEKLLADKFRAGQYDEGLSEGLAYLRSSLAANLKSVALTPTVPPLVKPPTKPMIGTARSAETTQTAGVSTAAATTPKIEASSAVPVAKPTVKERVEQEVGFKLIYIVYGIVGLLLLWILIGMIRHLFSPYKRPPQYGTPSQGGGQTHASGGQTYGGGGQQHPVGGQRYPASGPAQGAPGTGYVAGGPAQPMGGYVGGVPPAGGGGGGGGFVSGVLGGMLGGAAGSWVYDSVFRRSNPGGAGAPMPHNYGGDPQYSPGTGSGGSGGGAFVGGATGGAISSTGGDFNEPPGITSAGGDFDDDTGGKVTSAGGDFGDSPSNPVEPAAGGEFGAVADAGGDFGGQAADDSAGGDFGGQAADDSAGGDFGGGADSAGGSDSGGGGDSGGSSSGGSDGGDF